MPNNYSSEIEKVNEEYENTMFKLAMNLVAEKEGELFLKENEQLNCEAENTPSEEAIKRFKRRLNRQLTKTKRLIHPSRIINKVAMVFLILVFTFSAAMLTVQAFRVQVLNFLISFEPKYTTIQLAESSSSKNEQDMVVDWKNAYVPTYIPGGYEVESVLCSESFNRITFNNPKDDETFFVFTEYKSSNSIAFDTENASLVETVKVNGLDGTLIEKDSTVTIGWAMDNHLIVVQGQISPDEAIKIAENVKYIQ